jgi:hypothetical protein
MQEITAEQSEALAKMISFMAKTGIGTDACLRYKCLPLRVHYYSPVPDIADLERRNCFYHRSLLPGICWREEEQLAFLAQLGQMFGNECDWPIGPTQDSYQYYTENGRFGYGCATRLHCIIRYFRPRKVIEIGSGFSSLVISSALGINETPETEYTIIDPYPPQLIRNSFPRMTHLINERIELIDVAFFKRLEKNDVLFIDSSHTVKIDGDVNYLILEILPRLAQGVIVHFHDIPMPCEYPKVYYTNPQFRVFWTESYLLQAFLCFNSQFEILLAMSYLMTERKKEFSSAFKHYNPEKRKAISGSFWIRRKAKSLDD